MTPQSGKYIAPNIEMSMLTTDYERVTLRANDKFKIVFVGRKYILIWGSNGEKDITIEVPIHDLNNWGYTSL